MANDPWKTISLFLEFHGYHSLVFLRCSSYVHLTVWFYSKLRKSQNINLLYFITTFEHLRTPDMSSSHLKNFKILIPLLKKSNCLGLPKKNACLTLILAKSCIYHSPTLKEIYRPILKPTSVRLPSSAKLSTLSITLLRCGSFFCTADELIK